MGWFAAASGALRRLFKENTGNRENTKTGSDLLIVKRGLSPAYYFFCEVFAKERGLEVVPDRRVDERRRWRRETPRDDRRNFDRRGSTAWPKQDFIVVRNSRSTPKPPQAS